MSTHDMGLLVAMLILGFLSLTAPSIIRCQSSLYRS